MPSKTKPSSKRVMPSKLKANFALLDFTVLPSANTPVKSTLLPSLRLFVELRVTPIFKTEAPLLIDDTPALNIFYIWVIGSAKK